MLKKHRRSCLFLPIDEVHIMAFNPYTTRPIGSEQYEDHLLDVYTSAYYYNQLPVKEDNLVNLAATGKPLWRSPEPIDPYEYLVMAVTVQAVIDYVDAYKAWLKAKYNNNLGAEVLHHSRMLDIENTYFRRYDLTESIFERLLKELRDNDGELSIYHKSASTIASRIMKNYFHYKDSHCT